MTTSEVTTVKVHITNIEWDTYDEDTDQEYTAEECELPLEFDMTVELDEEDIDLINTCVAENDTDYDTELKEYVSELLTDLVSDEYGYCHYGFDFEITEKNEVK